MQVRDAEELTVAEVVGVRYLRLRPKLRKQDLNRANLVRVRVKGSGWD